MGAVKQPEPVKLICGILACDEGWAGVAREALRKALGEIDLTSDLWPFHWTSYYEAETGAVIVRQFVSFAATIDPGEIPEIKLRTNALEAELAGREGTPVQRPVNLDPGYVSESKLVLATTKDYSHRVYVSKGIYAEVTLHWHHGAFEAWPWTYRDYQSEEYRAFFTNVRERLRQDAGA